METSINDLISRSGLTSQTLTGQTAVVTGAGRGIGREVARALAWLGAQVVIAELDPISGAETERLIQLEGARALFIHTDVAAQESVIAVIGQARSAFGRVSILVNNAILCPYSPLAEMDVALWDRVVAVNLRGAFLTCRSLLPDMLAARQGVIVNMISVDAMPGLSAYIATKKGLAGFSQSLAMEVGEQSVRVIPFVPGMVDTPGIRGVASGLAPRLGLSEEQFLHMPLHPAFDGLMPPAFAGVATAFLIARLADEFHGETVTGYEVLERAGLIRPAPLPEPVGNQAASQSAQSHAVPELAQELGRILAKTEAEFRQLPLFIRPLARNGFKSKSGAALGDWQRLISSLEAGQPPPADLAARLEKLAGYYREVPGETARFSKDEEFLRQVTVTSQEREAAVRALQRAVVV
jgi:NAD(P)-dependent dehydrogenase (short-subunit alcohol dehydrogenase family)